MFQKIINDICEVKIQGAEAVAKASITAIEEVYHEKLALSNENLLKELEKAKKKLEETRPTEPCMRNTLNYLFYKLDEHNLRTEMPKRIEYTKKFFADSNKNIANIGEKKVCKGSRVFTFCHSSTVMSIFKEAKKNKKIFSVNNTETRPLFQGRITAKELTDEKIKVNHFIDSAMRIAIKQSDLVLIGADAITSQGKVINKIGSELVAEIAHKFDVPVYVCTNSWKFDPNTILGFDEIIEKRFAQEVWKDAPKGVNINNYAFEIVSSELITGIISELGVYSPDVFIEEMKTTYPHIFKK